MRFEAVLFDCDGVLVDSEPITNGVLRTMLAELGWHLTPQECMQNFVGKAVKDETEQIYQNTGFRVTDDWLSGFRDRRNVALERNLLPIPGIYGAVQALHTQFGGRLACASGADRFKVDLQLRKVGLHPFFEGQIYSGHEMPRSKPAPDVYLAAAAGLAAHASKCIVVEDTVTGATAGAAAGALVLGFAPTGDDAALRQAGAQHCFTHMSDLPKLVTTLLSS